MAKRWYERQEAFEAFVQLLDMGKVTKEGRDLIIDFGTDPNGEYVEIELGRYSFYPNEELKVEYNRKV